MLIDSSKLDNSLVFTAYSVTSEWVSNGQCVTTSGRSVPLNPPFTALKGTKVMVSDFYRYAVNSLAESIGFSLCGTVTLTENGLSFATGSRTFPNSINSTSPTADARSSASKTLKPPPTFASSLIESTVTSAPLAPPPGSGFGKVAKLGLGVGLPMIAAILLTLLALLHLKRRTRRVESLRKETEVLSDEHQPYFQPKGELDVEGSGKHELHAEDTRYYLGENGEICEMSSTHDHAELSSHGVPELEGGEHCQELGDVGNKDTPKPQ